MAIYKNALIALELSDQKPELITKIRQAMAIADEIHLCSVIEPFDSVYPISPMDGYPFSTTEFQEQIEQQAATELAKLAEHLDTTEDKTHLLIGKPATEIKALAQTIHCDIIMIGTHGKGAARAMLGSTSNGVLHDVPCDVLAIRYA